MASPSVQGRWCWPCWAEVQTRAGSAGSLSSILLAHAPFLVALGFFLIGLIRLGHPSEFDFDEQFYVPAAVNLAKATGVFNREHPMLSKEIMALVMTVFGYGPVPWRLGSLLFATLGLAGFARAASTWTGQPKVGLYVALLLAGNLLLLGMARLANPEPYLFGFIGLAMAAMARFSRSGGTAWLAVAGVMLGCATACKWSAAPVIAALILLFSIRFRRSPARIAQGLGLLGVLPVLVYFATFLPGAFMTKDALPVSDWFAMHLVMLEFHRGYFPPNPYNSNWLDWIAGRGAIWGVIGQPDGVWRAHLLAFNPLQAPILAVAGLVGVASAVRRDWELAVPAITFAALLAFWAVSGRDNQFLYYFLVPAAFATVSLAILIDRVRLHPLLKAGCVMLLVLPTAWAWPVLTMAPLKSERDIDRYTRLPGWQVHEQNLSYPEDRLEWIDTCLPHPRRCV